MFEEHVNSDMFWGRAFFPFLSLLTGKYWEWPFEKVLLKREWAFLILGVVKAYTDRGQRQNGLMVPLLALDLTPCIKQSNLIQLLTLETHSLESTDAKHLLFWQSWRHAVKLPLCQWQFWFLLPCSGMALTDLLLWNGYPRTNHFWGFLFFSEWPNKGLVFVHFVKLHLIGVFQKA